MSRVFCSLVVAVAMVGGCAHKQETKAEAPKSEPAPAPVASTAPAPSSAKTCASDLDCGAKQLCLNNKCVDITPDLAACTDVRVHFPFNSDEIDAADKPQLDRSARCLKADHALHITIEGNADERGTEEYNMALGDRRAHAVSDYLRSLGASDAQLQTVSYGKEHPLCSEHDEGCWSQNRRADLMAQNTTSKSHKKGHRK
jgi:peptidoglycan-associated lipoprotein